MATDNTNQHIVPTNFPVPSPMICTGDQVGNWEYFLQAWKDYQIALGLDKKSEKVRFATFRSIMGRECVQILQNLGITDQNKVKEAKENYVK